MKTIDTSTIILSDLFFFDKERNMLTSDRTKLASKNYMSKLNGFLVGFRIKSNRTGEIREFIHIRTERVYGKIFYEEFVNNETKLKVRIFL